MSAYTVAQQIPASMTADGTSYIPLAKDDLRGRLGIGRIEDKRAELIVREFERAGLLMHPAPKQETFVRVFRRDTDLGRFVYDLLNADGSDDAFRRQALRLEQASPPEVFGRIRHMFEDAGWVPPSIRGTTS